MFLFLRLLRVFGINQNLVGHWTRFADSSIFLAVHKKPIDATDIMAENLFYGGNGVMFYAISRPKSTTMHVKTQLQSSWAHVQINFE